MKLKNLKRIVKMPHVGSLPRMNRPLILFQSTGVVSHVNLPQANRLSRMLHPHSRLWVRQERKETSVCLPLWSLPGVGNELCTPEIVKQELTLRGVAEVVNGPVSWWCNWTVVICSSTNCMDHEKQVQAPQKRALVGGTNFWGVC